MSKDDVIQSLLATTAEIGRAETAVCALEVRRRAEEFHLKDQEARLLADDGSPIMGKNAEVRAAQLHTLTAPERVLVMDLEQQLLGQKAILSQHRTMHRSLLAIAGLLSGAVDGEIGIG